MAQVYRLMVRCPATSKVVDTGIRTSGRESLNSDIYDGGLARCTLCRQFHSLPDDGFLELDRESLPHDLWRPNP